MKRRGVDALRNVLPLALLCVWLLGAKAPGGTLDLDTQRLNALAVAAQMQVPKLQLAAVLDDSVQSPERARYTPAALSDYVAATTRSLDGVPDSVQHRCLAEAVYFEARGEPVVGQLAVAQVVLNRVKSRNFPKTVCDVVYEVRPDAHTCQFSFACDGLPDTLGNEQAWRQAQAIALIAASGSWRDVTGDATYFHARYVDPHWASVFPRTRSVGGHIFYREQS
jgi:spore germination cell wall hydrolase CwlJ-like protein